MSRDRLIKQVVSGFSCKARVVLGSGRGFGTRFMNRSCRNADKKIDSGDFYMCMTKQICVFTAGHESHLQWKLLFYFLLCGFHPYLVLKHLSNSMLNMGG